MLRVTVPPPSRTCRHCGKQMVVTPAPQGAENATLPYSARCSPKLGGCGSWFDTHSGPQTPPSLHPFES